MVTKISRKGVSLIEIIICIAILALLLGLLLPAIQMVRESATRTESSNNLRQIALGVHQLADERAGKVNNLADTRPFKFYDTQQSLFWEILPYTYQSRPVPPENAPHDVLLAYFSPDVKIYRSPGDPTLHLFPVYGPGFNRCSYSFNMTALDGGLTLPFSMPDGMSSTICITEHIHAAIHNQTLLDWSIAYPTLEPHLPEPNNRRRATFADKGWNDVIPITDPTTRTTRASIPGVTFQVKPRLEDVRANIPSSPFSSGLPIALFDGSVRTLRAGMSESVFWSLVTPNGGEVVGDF